MTKLRAPDSIEDAVLQAAALLGDQRIARALSFPALGVTVSASLVGKWSNAEAPQRIALHQALAIEGLLVEAGHAPIFIELFARLAPAPAATAEEAADPLREAMRATGTAADLMAGVDRAMVDGRIDRAELGRLDQLTHKAQRQIARLRRVIRAVQGGSKAK